MDDHYRKSAGLLECHQSPPSESSSAAFYGKHLLNDILLDISIEDPRENLTESQDGRRQSPRLNNNLNKRRITSTDAYTGRPPTPTVREQNSKAMEQALEKFKLEVTDTLRECLRDDTGTRAANTRIKEAKRSATTYACSTNVCTKASAETPMVPSKKAITLKLHQADPAKPVLSDNDLKSVDINRVMDEHIPKTFGDRLNVTENFISTAKRLPTNSFKQQA
ncbi:hypothetical protein E3P91_02340 [Wallemia ichthyophaga]|nr:hypothetical protein E3P91_02340 [Wallemia ichthyophaga]